MLDLNTAADRAVALDPALVQVEGWIHPVLTVVTGLDYVISALRDPRTDH